MLERLRTLAEYGLAALLMLGGVQTALDWQSDTVLAQVFYTPYLVLTFGILFFIAGAGILLSKLKKWPVWEGRTLYFAFLLLLFSLLLEVTIFIDVSTWVDNLILVLYSLVLRVSFFVKERTHHGGDDSEL